VKKTIFNFKILGAIKECIIFAQGKRWDYEREGYKEGKKKKDWL